ncbi:carboxypeptidase-like regulatory domain-containing protein [Pedobacter sp. CCM 8938]|uniref:Carboxypeptidase-like regulatory domain-containing protein n=2 Tax=Pedobacter fastidiosus TaxID=2765361 RepID=A0ABR7KP83_9SPHI|nr:carboxypeptidase-like regulatory domain-containing protein [Pedobacter fastidiosus]MBC6109887.1 carboxypeptidase-like regulatory domain-containing protein [Pedobacter fastidiosus]
MGNTEHGKFCSACNKEVIDFTKMSQIELLNYFKKFTNEVCGTINPNQLAELNLRRSKKYSLKPLSLKMMIASSITFLSYTKVFPASLISTNQVSGIESPKRKNVEKGDSLSYKIRGAVFDIENNLPIGNVTVKLKNGSRANQTDEEGKFEFIVKGRKEDKIVLSVNHIGYCNQELEVVLGEVKSDYKISIKAEECSLDDINVVGTKDIRRQSLVGMIEYIKRPSFFKRVIIWIKKTL